MSYLDKEAYERREAYANRRMAENREIESLTQEQHYLLQDLCRFRHELHCNWDEAFNCESGSYKYFANEISEWYESGIRERVMDLFGTAPFQRKDYPTSYEDDEYESYEECFEIACDIFESINEEIEAFLTQIDEKHGTDYCPTGKTRIF